MRWKLWCISTNNRSRLNPSLSPDYFGSYVQAVITTTTVRKLLSHRIGWAAWLLHEAVNGHTDSKVREWLEVWMKSPSIYPLRNFFDPYGIIIGSSPRFNMYGYDFGWGKPEAIRSGIDNKCDGRVISYPGHQGGGSVDLEVSLLPESMSALESDQEFIDAVSPSQQHQM
ncbi:BAHD acyltransferase DCR-like [Telopea speciosissima]|uniref:BAHD acyltransferase DCR-like n=1 Tax=Telopea speciosissima TaxID=54955 RepID=UPI001CC38AEF|nr:BAHD acyltransferase DCR-like [Telopea speciosissima]